MVRSVFMRVEYPSSGNNTGSTDSSHKEETGFDVNTVVVLAALLCTLIAALALNSIIHYALRRRRALLDNPEVTKVEGLKKQSIKKIPVEVIQGDQVLAAECSICLGRFVDGEKVRVLPECNHEFHVKCVDQWLLDHMSCPNCRHLVAVPRI